MKFKKMEEVHEGNYPTYEESKNTLWKLIMSSKNVGIGVFCVYLLFNEGCANPFEFPMQVVGGMVLHVPTFKEGIIVGVGLTLFILLFVCIIVELIKNIIKKISVIKEDKKE